MEHESAGQRKRVQRSVKKANEGEKRERIEMFRNKIGKDGSVWERWRVHVPDRERIFAN